MNEEAVAALGRNATGKKYITRMNNSRMPKIMLSYG